MQRPTSSARASSDNRHQHVIDIMQQSQDKYSPRKKTEGFIRQSFSAIWSIPASKWIHLVPAIVFLCIFILIWWFSYPVNLKIKDGRIIATHKIELPQPLNETHFDLTILALATPPNGSIPQTLTPNNATEAQPVSSIE
ncbi:hypothetical protein Acr_13g0006060 [Actinidia rufa]|uniref:Uncharacterized protein n=1 Tax=Actinidia rufa TaxID=165716 RepID=A0A7J0FKI5_9ERIC|nr:hypothetical protein Acr_13g0006060 [Actinidia rufa]